MSPTSLGINFIAASEKLLLEGTTSNSFISKSVRLLHNKAEAQSDVHKMLHGSSYTG